MLKIHKAHISNLVLMLSFCIYAGGQSLHFQSYTTAEGLSQNSIYSIAQTKEGFMWFGTQDGLNRFDGKNFWLANLNDHVTNSGLSKMITALLPDKKDKFWVGTVQELLIYDRYINRFYSPEKIYAGFTLSGKHYIKKLLEDKQGNIWILTKNEGVYAYNYLKHQMLQIKWQDSLPRIEFLTIDDNGNVWACSEDRIFKWTGDVFIPVSIPKTIKEINEFCVVDGDFWLSTKLSEVIILKQHEGFKAYLFTDLYKGPSMLSDPNLLHQSDSNTVWIGSRSEGVIKVNLAEKKFIKSQNGNGYPFLKSPFCLSFFTTTQGNTWVGLSGGLAMYDKNKIDIGLWRTDAIPGHPFPDNRVFSIYTPNDEDFYLGTLYRGLHYLNIKSNLSSYYLPPGVEYGSASSKNIYGIIEDKNGLLWMATWAGLYSFDVTNKKFQRYYDPEDEKTIQLTSILMLGNTGKILCGGYNDGLKIFNTATKKFEECKDPQRIADTTTLRVRYMKETGDGNILMSTEAKGLIRYNYLSGRFTFFPQFAAVSESSRYFLEDGETLWVATDDGLIQADRASMKVQKLWSTANGLPNNYIYGILTDRYGRIWISSNGGISMLDKLTGIIESFTVNDGLQDMEFNTASCYKSKEGMLWFGGINGLNMINPGLTLKMQKPFTPLIIQINVMNMPYKADVMAPYIHAIRLPYSQNFINFEFQSPDFTSGGNTVYEYILTGVDTGWVNSKGRNFANYTNLAPGSYTFKIRAINAKNIVSENSESLVVTIYPPWYKTWWFYMIAVASLLSVVLFIIRQKIVSVKYKAGIRQQITETEMAALKAQMNPHFIFNCINSIDAFIHSNDKYNATLYLNKFAKLLRNILDSSKQNTVAFTKDVETLKLYTELEGLRNDNKFEVVFTVDEALLNNDYKVPPLIVQPFVENAILHGLKNREENGGLLQIKIERAEDKIQYSITDNGIGRKAAALMAQNKESSYGMQMSYDRIKLFNKEEKASVEITDLYKGDIATGTAVKVLLNII